jgi:preprotein translocase subunit SecG
MEAVMVTLIILSSIALIALIVMQSGKSEGLAGAISGGAEQLFGKKKARGLDAVLQKATIVASVVFFVATFALAYII